MVPQESHRTCFKKGLAVFFFTFQLLWREFTGGQHVEQGDLFLPVPSPPNTMRRCLSFTLSKMFEKGLSFIQKDLGCTVKLNLCGRLLMWTFFYLNFFQVEQDIPAKRSRTDCNSENDLITSTPQTRGLTNKTVSRVCQKTQSKGVTNPLLDLKFYNPESLKKNQLYVIYSKFLKVVFNVF